MHRAVFLVVVLLAPLACAAPAGDAARSGRGDDAPLPVLLVPGFAAFRDLGAMGNYFGALPATLRARGVDVHQATLPPFAGSEERAHHLAATIDAVVQRTGARRLHVIAHSQGGVDARIALAALGVEDRVATLTTISTPHDGAPIADLARELPEPLLAALFGALGGHWQGGTPIDLGDPDVIAALDSLSTAGMARFAEAYADPPHVPIFSVAGATGEIDDGACDGGLWEPPDVVDAPHPWLLPSWLVLRDAAGTNDGTIHASRARRGTFLGCVPADHLDETGRGLGSLEPFHAAAFYGALIDALRAVEGGDVDAVARRAHRIRDAARR